MRAAVGLPAATVVEVLVLWAFANGYAPWLSLAQHPYYLAALALVTALAERGVAAVAEHDCRIAAQARTRRAPHRRAGELGLVARERALLERDLLLLRGGLCSIDDGDGVFLGERLLARGAPHAGLGVVELTVAIHYVFDTPYDRLIWDVGHQAYPHKILTGRRDELNTIRKYDGLAPFCSVFE